MTGRARCAVGRGDSALRYIGRRPEALAASLNAMNVVRALFAGREADLGRTNVSIPWHEGLDAKLSVGFAAYGPKALDVVGRHADGFALQLAEPKIPEWTLQALRDAAEDEGRDPDTISVCVVAPVSFGDDLADQRDQLHWFGGWWATRARVVNRPGLREPGLTPGSPEELCRGLGAKPQLFDGVLRYLVERDGLARLPNGLLLAAPALERFQADLLRHLHRR